MVFFSMDAETMIFFLGTSWIEGFFNSRPANRIIFDGTVSVLILVRFVCKIRSGVVPYQTGFVS